MSRKLSKMYFIRLQRDFKKNFGDSLNGELTRRLRLNETNINLLIFQYIDPHTVKDNDGDVDGEQYLEQYIKVEQQYMWGEWRSLQGSCARDK